MSNNTIDILASINKGVQFIVEHMSPQNSSEKQISKLNRGGAELVRDNGGDAPKVELKADSVKNIVAALNAMSPAILNIANLSGRQQKRFKNVMKTVVDVMDMMNAAGERYGDSENLNKMLDSLSKSFTIVDKVLKQMSVWTVLGPVALLGGIMAIPAFVTMGLLFKLIGAMGINKDTGKAFDDMSSAFNKMTGVILKMTLVTVLLMGLGYILLNADTSKFILGGLIMFTGVMLVTIGVMLLTGLASKLVKDFAFNALKDMMVLILGMTLIMGVFYLFGAFMDNVWEIVGKGLLLFGGVCIAMLTVIGLAALASKFITDSNGIKSLGLMYVYIFASMGVIIAAKYLADFISENQDKILIGLLYTGGVVLGIVGIALLTNLFKSTVLQGVGAIALVVAVAYLSMGIVLGALKLSEMAEGKWVGITLTLLAVTGVLLLFVGLAAAATFAAPYIVPGAAALLLVSAFALSTIFTAKSIIDFHKFKEESGVSWEDIGKNVLGLSAVIGVFGILAAALGPIMPFILAGTVSSVALTAFVACSVGIAKQIISLRSVIAENNTDWETIHKDVLGLSIVMGAFGILGAALGPIMPFVLAGTVSSAALVAFVVCAVTIAKQIISLRSVIAENNTDWKIIHKDVLGLSTVIGVLGLVGSAMSLTLPGVLLGMVAITPLTGFVIMAVGIIDSIANLKTKIDKIGGYKKLRDTITVDMKNIMSALNYKNLDFPLSVFDIIKLTASYASISALTSSFVRVGSDISKLARLIGVVDNQGRIAPVLSINEETGEIIYGEYADIKSIAKTITETIKIFTTNLEFGLNDVSKMQSTQRVMEVLGEIISPVSTFVEALTKYDVDDKGRLAIVEIDENGKVKVGKYVNVKAVAMSISEAVTTFTKTLFSAENCEKWNKIVYGDAWFGQSDGFKAATAVMGVFANIIAPVSEFVELVTKLEARDGKIRRIEYDDKGNIKGEFVDLKAVATSISGAITTFAQTLFSSKNIDTLNAAENLKDGALNTLVSIVNTISTFSKTDTKKLNDSSNSTVKSISSINTVIITSNPNFKDFSNVIIKLKDNLSVFDDVLIKDSDKRNKAINDLKDSVTALVDALGSGGDKISSLSSLLGKLENIDKSKIQDNAEEIKKALKIVSSGASGGSGGSGETGSTVKSLSQEEVVEAIKDALDGMLLFQQSMKRTIDGKDGSVVHYRFEPDSE